MVVSAFGRRLAAGITASVLLASLPLSIALATVDGPRYPVDANNDSGAGVTAWTAPNNILANDSSFASISTGSNSQYLRAKDFGFTVPVTATITGIQVQIGRRATQNGGPGTRDLEVRVWKGGTGVIGDNKADTATDWPTGTDVVSYGGNGDLWGTSWTPANINSANFGSALRVTRNGETAEVDFIRMRVWYTDAQTINVTTPAPTNATYGTSFAVAADATSGLAVSITTSGGCSIAGNTVTMQSGSVDCTVHYNQAGNGNFSPATEVQEVVLADPRPLTPGATASNKVFDGNTMASVTLSDDRLGGDDVILSYASADFDTAAVGNGKTVTVTGIFISGGSNAADYSLASNTAVTTADITAASGCTATLTPGDNIQNAVNAATAGDTICLNPGTYTLASAININKALTLTKAGCDANAVTARTPGSASEAILNGNNAVSNVVLISANNVTVSCLEIKNATGDAVTSVNANPPKTGVVVKNNIVHNAGDEGIQLKRTDGAVIQYNHVYSTTGDGINISENTTNGQILDNKVHDSSSNDGAIYVYSATNTTIQGNLLYNVSGNDAIKMGNKNGADIAMNGGIIAENVIVTGSQDAVSVYMSNVEVWGNKIKNSTSAQGAIYVRGGNNNVDIHDNLIVDNATTGVKVGGTGVTSNVTVNDNCIDGNNAGITVFAGTPTLNAEDNWWGDASGPSGAGPGTGDSVPANVDFTPFNTTGCALAPIVDLNNDGIPDGSDDPLAIGPFATTTTLSSDLDPSVYGDTVTFTATVAGDAPTGSVEFRNGTGSMATVALNPTFATGAIATFSLSTLASGSHDITAVYLGDVQNLTSTSAILVQDVDLKPLTITASNQSKVYGDSFAFAGTEFGTSSMVAGDSVASVTLASAATATGAAAGSHAITPSAASGSGLSNYDITYVDGTFTVSPALLTVTADDKAREYGVANPTLTATFTGFANGEVLGTSDVTGSPDLTTSADNTTASGSVVAIVASTGSLVSNNYDFIFVNGSLTVTSGTTTTSTVLDMPTPASIVGEDATFNVTVTGASPTGNVEFRDNGVTIATVALTSTGAASFTTNALAVGTHPIQAFYLGDSNHSPSNSSVETFHVIEKDSPDTVTTISSSGSSLVGASVDLTAEVFGAFNPTGIVEFYDGLVLIGTGSLNGSFQATLNHTFTSAGNHDITAHYQGDGNNNASVSGVEILLVQEVRKDTPTTDTVLSVANPSTIGDTVVMTADVTGGYGPTGVVFFKDGGVFIGSGALVGGTASFSTDQLAVGSHDLTAEYQGDANNNASTSAVVTVQVVQQMTSVTILGNIPTPVEAPASVTFTVTVNGYFPTGTVVIHDGPSAILNITLSNGSGSFTQVFAGEQTSHIFKAEYLGDVNNTASMSPDMTVFVTAPSQQVAGTQNQGAGSNRGNNTQRAANITAFLANLHLGDLPPGAFGGADAPLAGSEKEFICSIQRSLPRLYTSAYVNALAKIVSEYTGRTVDVIAGWLRDPSACADITEARLGVERVAQATLTPFYVSSEGFPLSKNPTWNKCVTGKFTYEDIQSNPDRDNKGTPKSCADYHTGSSWYHPDHRMFFDWNVATKKLTLPGGYVIKKDEAVSVR